MTAKLYGNWNEVAGKLAEIDEDIQAAMRKSILQTGYKIQAIIVKHIQNQDLKWAALNERYKAWKEANNLSNNTWIATSLIMNSINVKPADDGDVVFIGVLRSAGKHKGSNADMVLIASVLEYGSEARGIPARPLFAPSFKEQLPKIAPDCRKAIQSVLDPIQRAAR